MVRYVQTGWGASRGAHLAVCSIALALLMSACGGSSSEKSSSDKPAGAVADTTTTVKFAYLPNPGIASIFVGIDQGFFKEEGIDLVPKEVTAQQLTPSLISGESDIAFDAIQGVLGSVSNGLPLQVLAQVSTNEEGALGGTGRELLVKKGSTVKSAKDLVGKKAAFQRLGAAGDTAVQILAREQSGDPKAEVKLLALPATSMESALLKGDVDAAQVTDPSATKMIASGKFESLGDPPADAFGPAPDKVITCAAKWAKENASVAAALSRAIAKSAEYAQANPDAVRKVLVEHWKTPEEIAKDTHWPKFSSQIDMAELEKVYKAMQELGYVKKPIDLPTLIVSAS